jgi:hypothetical protein
MGSIWSPFLFSCRFAIYSSLTPPFISDANRLGGSDILAIVAYCVHSLKNNQIRNSGLIKPDNAHIISIM